MQSPDDSSKWRGETIDNLVAKQLWLVQSRHFLSRDFGVKNGGGRGLQGDWGKAPRWEEVWAGQLLLPGQAWLGTARCGTWECRSTPVWCLRIFKKLIKNYSPMVGRLCLPATPVPQRRPWRPLLTINTSAMYQQCLYRRLDHRWRLWMHEELCIDGWTVSSFNTRTTWEWQRVNSASTWLFQHPPH